MQAQATAPTVMNPVERALGQTFIRHPLADEALKDLDRLFRTPPSAEHGWCGLLIGPTGAGKSAVLRAFCSQHKPSNDPGLVQPVVSVELPDKCNTRTLSEVLLKAQKHPAAGRQMSIPELEAAAIAHLKRQRTKCIIFDEAQHAIRGDTYQAANFFKHILNEAQVNIVLAGLPSTAQLLDNEQLESRGSITAELRAFDWWDREDKRAFLGVLKQLQAMVRFPVLGFNLIDPDWAWRFAYGSKGLMRPIVKLLMLLEVQAEEKDFPSITEDMLKGAWSKLPKRDRLGHENPFELGAIPSRWKPAHSRTGERD